MGLVYLSSHWLLMYCNFSSYSGMLLLFIIFIINATFPSFFNVLLWIHFFLYLIFSLFYFLSFSLYSHFHSSTFLLPLRPSLSFSSSTYPLYNAPAPLRPSWLSDTVWEGRVVAMVWESIVVFFFLVGPLWKMGNWRLYGKWDGGKGRERL